MKKNNEKPSVKQKAAHSANTSSSDIAKSFQMLLENKELVFQFMDMFPIPIEVFASDGTSIYTNRTAMEWLTIKDPGLLWGKYNLLNDPVCNDQMGLRDNIQRAFRGEAVVVYDIVPPIQDLVDRGVIDEKPFEKSFTDFYLYPVKNKGKVAYVVFVCVIKKLYYGRPDLARAKEYIDTHWKEVFDPRILAKSMDMSVTKLYKIFKEHTDMTPGDYHKKCKVERIKEKLMDNNLTIKQAFAACGEDSQGRIARVFKNITGMSPKEFRNSV